MIKIGDKVRHTSPSIKGFGEVIEVDLKEDLVVVLFAKDKKFTFGLDETSDFVTPANDEFKALKGRADMIAECRNELRSLTNDGVTFSKLDSYFINERGLNPDEYKKIKDDYLKEYFKNKINDVIVEWSLILLCCCVYCLDLLPVYCVLCLYVIPCKLLSF